MDKLNKDELFMLAIELDLPTLLRFCASDKRIDSLICKRNEIWNYRLEKDFKKEKEEFKEDINLLKPLDKYKFLYSLTSLKRKIDYQGSILKLFNEERLDLRYKKLTKIPKEIGNLINLQIFLLSDNKIKKIPKEIGNLINLRELYLYNNQIKEIPKEIGNLINLRKLSFAYNEIKEIPKEIGNLINLQELYLDNNQIKEIPKEILNMYRLRYYV